MQAVLVALLTSPVVIWFLSRFDKRNTEQHANNMKVLQDIHESVNQVGDDVKEVRKDLYDHIAFHAHKETTTDGTTRGTGTKQEHSDLLRREIA